MQIVYRYTAERKIKESDMIDEHRSIHLTQCRSFLAVYFSPFRLSRFGQLQSLWPEWKLTSPFFHFSLDFSPTDFHPPLLERNFSSFSISSDMTKMEYAYSNLTKCFSVDVGISFQILKIIDSFINWTIQIA